MSSNQGWLRRRRSGKATHRAWGRRRLRPDVLVLEDRRLMATVIPVTSAADSGSGTLRAAIAQADAATTPVTIDFHLPKGTTIDLTSGQLELSNTAVPIAIDGPGAEALTIDGGGIARILQIDPGVEASISGLTIRNGWADTDGGGVLNDGTMSLTGVAVIGSTASGSAYFAFGSDVGGGIRNDGTATLKDCTISGNIASYGGGLSNVGEVTLEGCTIADNSAVDGGGGVSNDAGTATIIACSFSDNTDYAGDGGGGLDNGLGAVTVTDSTFIGNSVTYDGYAYGGAVANYGTATVDRRALIGNTATVGGGLYNGATLKLTDSQFHGDVAATSGGALCNSSSGHGSIAGCTFAGNAAGSDGGGISIASGALTITNSSVTGNTAGGEGGGLFVQGASFYGGGELTAKDVIVAGNSAPTGGGIFNGGNATATDLIVSDDAATDGGGIANADGATARIADSAILGNHASGDGGGGANAGSIKLTGSLILGNTAAGDGGGLSDGGIAALTDCLVSGNSAASGGGIYAASGGSVTLTGTLVLLNKKDNIVGAVTDG